MKTKQTAKTADKTWVYVEPYLYKNADSGRYYSRFGRQGFRALKTDRVTVARLRWRIGRMTTRVASTFTMPAGKGDVSVEHLRDEHSQAAAAKVGVLPATGT